MHPDVSSKPAAAAKAEFIAVLAAYEKLEVMRAAPTGHKPPGREAWEPPRRPGGWASGAWGAGWGAEDHPGNDADPVGGPYDKDDLAAFIRARARKRQRQAGARRSPRGTGEEYDDGSGGKSAGGSPPPRSNRATALGAFAQEALGFLGPGWWESLATEAAEALDFAHWGPHFEVAPVAKDGEDDDTDAYVVPGCAAPWWAWPLAFEAEERSTCGGSYRSDRGSRSGMVTTDCTLGSDSAGSVHEHLLVIVSGRQQLGHVALAPRRACLTPASATPATIRAPDIALGAAPASAPAPAEKASDDSPVGGPAVAEPAVLDLILHGVKVAEAWCEPCPRRPATHQDLRVVAFRSFEASEASPGASARSRRAGAEASVRAGSTFKAPLGRGELVATVHGMASDGAGAPSWPSWIPIAPSAPASVHEVKDGRGRHCGKVVAWRSPGVERAAWFTPHSGGGLPTSGGGGGTSSTSASSPASPFVSSFSASSSSPSSSSSAFASSILGAAAAGGAGRAAVPECKATRAWLPDPCLWLWAPRSEAHSRAATYFELARSSASCSASSGISGTGTNTAGGSPGHGPPQPGAGSRARAVAPLPRASVHEGSSEFFDSRACFAPACPGEALVKADTGASASGEPAPAPSARMKRGAKANAAAVPRLHPAVFVLFAAARALAREAAKKGGAGR